ncbi:MAG: VWA-like domain-containing protein [Vulcanimicrobiota bacterium]
MLKLNRWHRLLLESRFLKLYPHYAGLLARLEVVQTRTVQCMAVAVRRLDEAQLLLLYNGAYFEQFPEYFAGILRHEINHVVCGHLTHSKYHRVAYPRVMEAAMELTANEGIQEPLPADGFALEDFAQFGIQPGQSTLERYRLLRQAVQDGRLQMERLWRCQSLDNHRPGLGSGLGDVLDAKCDRSSQHNWKSEAGWGLGAPTSRALLQHYRECIQLHLAGERGGLDDLQDSRRHRFPKDLERVLVGAPGCQCLDWRRILRQSLPPARRLHPDYVKPNRRFPERVGEIPGRRRQPPLPRILVGVDTSGSMSGAALDRVAREIYALSAHARVLVVECDATVQRIYPLNGRLSTFVGGGDTDFHPVFAEAERDRWLDGLVYFTDGKGPRPAGSAVSVLWALTHDQPFLTDFGQVVRLPP